MRKDWLLLIAFFTATFAPASLSAAEVVRINEFGVLPVAYSQTAGSSAMSGEVASIAPVVESARGGNLGSCRDCNGDCNGDCGDGCGAGCGKGDCGCVPYWAHRNSVMAELMLLRARDVEVAYAVPIDGPIAPGAPGAQVGPTGVADLEYDVGFRVGFNWALDDCSSVAMVYSHFDSAASDTITATAPDVVRSLVMHPNSANAAVDNLMARATNSVDFQLVDLDFRHAWSASDCHVVNWVVGARYAHLDQDFSSEFENLGISTVDTDIKFDGGGLRLGLEAERRARGGLSLFAKGYASFVAGDFDASYRQYDVISDARVYNSWNAGRVVTMLDLEAGLAWTSFSGRVRATAGYVLSGWYNTAKTNDWINAVRTGNYLDMTDSEVLTFDGFTTRLEYRW
ncbi:MAG: Lpg1974 family pore-forming outer membrane protein [Pirellulales bacterium]